MSFLDRLFGAPEPACEDVSTVAKITPGDPSTSSMSWSDYVNQRVWGGDD